MNRGAFHSAVLGLVLSLGLLGCGEEAPLAPAIAVIAPAGPIPFGQGFAVAIKRRFPRDAAAEPFDPRGLLPFAIIPEGLERRAIAGGIEEVYRFRAHAFLRGSVVIPPQRLVLFAESSGERIECFSPPVTLELSSGLQDGDPLSLELPDSRAEWPESHVLQTAVSFGVALFALLAFLRLYGRPRRTLSLAEEPIADLPARVDPWAHFERRLAELREQAAAMDAHAFHEALYAAWITAMQATSAERAERTAVEWQIFLRASDGRTQSSQAFLTAEDRFRFAPGAADPESKALALRLAEASGSERRAGEGGRP